MRPSRDYYPQCPEALVVSLAQNGDRHAFEELVKRRQSMVRNLMRRLSGDNTLADDLAQQTFLQAWSRLKSLKKNRCIRWLAQAGCRFDLATTRQKEGRLKRFR